MMRGIDISAWQSDIDPAAVDADFVIVKATGGTSYVNPSWRWQVDRAVESGKKIGLYHFAGDSDPGSWDDEAEHFLSTVSDYAGRAVMVLDWEADATSWPISWAESWLQRVSERTGSTPWFYSYSNYVNSHDCSSIARFPLWIAAYYAGYEPMGYQDDPPLYGGTGDWDHATCYQYSSTGIVNGYGGRLDINRFYGSRDDWESYYGGGSMRKENMVETAIGIANDDSRGYSQASRWPWEGSDFDCSSLMYWSAHEAGYDVPLSGYTGTMRADFTNAGFTAYAYGSVELERGDILLAHNDNRQHTEMYVGDGMTVGAHSSETGGIYGEPGDQTGNEISIAPIYGDWDWVLRPPESEDDVSAKDVWEYNWENTAPGGNMYNTLVEVYKKVDNMAQDVWGYNWQETAPGGNMYNAIVSMNMQIAALSEAVKELAKSKGANPDKIAKAVDDAVKARLEKIKLNVKAS